MTNSWWAMAIIAFWAPARHDSWFGYTWLEIAHLLYDWRPVPLAIMPLSIVYFPMWYGHSLWHHRFRSFLGISPPNSLNVLSLEKHPSSIQPPPWRFQPFVGWPLAILVIVQSLHVWISFWTLRLPIGSWRTQKVTCFWWTSNPAIERYSFSMVIHRLIKCKTTDESRKV